MVKILCENPEAKSPPSSQPPPVSCLWEEMRGCGSVRFPSRDPSASSASFLSPESSIGFPGNLSKPLLCTAAGTSPRNRAGLVGSCLLEPPPLLSPPGCTLGTSWGPHPHSGNFLLSNQHRQGGERRRGGYMCWLWGFSDVARRVPELPCP